MGWHAQAPLDHKQGEPSTRRASVPDGRYLAFLSARLYEKETDQLWLLDRSGGEAERLTELEGGITGYAWSPDGKQLVLVVDDKKEKTPLAGEPDPPESGTAPGDGGSADEKKDEKEKRPRPIVLDRLQFKQDKVGYLGKERSHLHLLDLATRKTVTLTSGPYNEFLPAWSPDGASVAFVSKRGDDPDRHNNWDVYVMKARHGAGAAQLTRSKGSDSDPDYDFGPEWSPDGRSIAYLHGGDPKKMWYAIAQVAVIGTEGGEPRPSDEQSRSEFVPAALVGRWQRPDLHSGRRWRIVSRPGAGFRRQRRAPDFCWRGRQQFRPRP